MKWFFKEMFKENGEISSKRVMAAILLINSVFLSYFKPTPEIINSFLLGGGALLGVSIAKSFTPGIKGKVNEK